MMMTGRRGCGGRGECRKRGPRATPPSDPTARTRSAAGVPELRTLGSNAGWRRAALPLPPPPHSGPAQSRTKTSRCQDRPARGVGGGRWAVLLGIEQVRAASPGGWETLLVRKERPAGKAAASHPPERAGRTHRPDDRQRLVSGHTPPPPPPPRSRRHTPPNPHSGSQGACSLPSPSPAGQSALLPGPRQGELPGPRPNSPLRPRLPASRCYQPSACTDLTPHPARAGGGRPGTFQGPRGREGWR